MTDLFTYEVWASLLASLTAIGGFLLFSFIMLFSSWVRPFLVESKRNFALWLRGRWSLLTGSPKKVVPDAVPFEVE